MTPREFSAMREVWLDVRRQNAQIVATLYNAHWDTEGVPMTADDILGFSDRENRLVEARRMKWKAAKVMMNATKPQEAPKWLLGVIEDNELKRYMN